ncbi:MAG: phosphatidylglycerol lysyltransferase domain-containing protein [Stenotrophobium sp.]
MQALALYSDMPLLAAGGGLGYGAIYLRHRRTLRAEAERLYNSLEPAAKLLPDQSIFGYNPHALISLHQDGRVWRDPQARGGIMFQRVGGVWLAAGDPIAPQTDWRQLVKSFMGAAQAVGAQPAFVPATEHFAGLARDWGYSILKVGASPYFDLPDWHPRGDRAKHLRWSVNRARREDLRVASTLFCPILVEECRQVCVSWLSTRPAAANFGWLFSLDPMCFAEHKRFFTARNRNGDLVGLLAASPIAGRKGWYLEDVLRRGDSPDGTADLLVFEALQFLRESGASLATLGTALLSSDGDDLSPKTDWHGTRRGLRLAKHALADVYHFDGIRNFKAKFVPNRWEGEYAIVPASGAIVPFQVVSSILKVMLPDGILSILRKRKPATGCA